MTTQIVFTTVPDAVLADSLAIQLIESGLAACVKALPPCTSTYRWAGKVERTTEIPLLIVTTSTSYAALEQSLKQSHPYDVPEILAIDCTEGLPEYLSWVSSVTTGALPS